LAEEAYKQNVIDSAEDGQEWALRELERM
jgi:hypothetical protein